MIVKPANTPFREMLKILTSTDNGKVLDSFIRVEMGEDQLHAAWDSFKDVADYFDEEYYGERAMMSQFLLVLDDELEFANAGLRPCL